MKRAYIYTFGDIEYECRVTEPTTGRTLAVKTTEPGCQLWVKIVFIATVYIRPFHNSKHYQFLSVCQNLECKLRNTRQLLIYFGVMKHVYMLTHFFSSSYCAGFLDGTNIGREKVVSPYFRNILSYICYVKLYYPTRKNTWTVCMQEISIPFGARDTRDLAGFVWKHKSTQMQSIK